MSELRQREQEQEAESARINAGRKPKFGDRMRNPWAGEGNPQRDGYFVREGRRTGNLNPGRYYEFTDGNGKFWELRAQFPFFVDTQPPEAVADKLGAVKVRVTNLGIGGAILVKDVHRIIDEEVTRQSKESADQSREAAVQEETRDDEDWFFNPNDD